MWARQATETTRIDPFMVFFKKDSMYKDEMWRAKMGGVNCEARGSTYIILGFTWAMVVVKNLPIYTLNTYTANTCMYVGQADMTFIICGTDRQYT